MRRKFKRTVAVVMALLMVTTTIFATASTVSAAEVTESEVGAGSGVTGDCTWTLDDHGTLIISGDGAMEDYGGSRLAPWGQNIKHVEIRYGVTSIGRRAFWRCSRLTDVLIPYSVTNIGLSAFYACTSLKDVIIPDNVTTVDAQAFEGCTSLTDVFMLDGSGSDTLIRYSAFSSCPNLETMVIPDDVTQFEYRAIYDCPKLTIYGKTGSAAKSFANANGFRFAPMRDSGLTGDCAWMLDNENTLTIMGSGSTGNYTYRYSSPWICYDNEISKVVIKDGVTRVGDYSFFCCTAITSAELSDSVETIGDNAFHSCIGLTDITIPGGVTSIEAYAFSNCRGLTSIEIPGNVSSIGGYAFVGCSELTSAEICDGVTSIGEAAFQYCPKLAYVELPDSVTSIGEAAFLDCSKDLVIRGEIDSEAQRFAGENNISFVALNGGDNSASNKMGDVNFDGVVSVFDVTQVQKYIAMFIDFTEQQRLVSDVNNDGRVDITDATRLQRYVAGFEGSLGKYFKAEFSVSSDNEVYSDQKVSAYVKPVGGKSTYTYNYGYILNGEKTYVRTDHTETKPFFSYYYRFPVAGTYTPFVEVVDGDGAKTTTTLSKSITVIESIKASPECTVSFVGSDEYDSKVKDIQIFDKDGNLFTRNVDYDILAYYKLEEGTYKKTTSSNLREVGKYKITIQWEREYSNIEDYEVEVKRCNLQNNQTSVKWSPVGGTWNGNSIKKGLTVEVKNSGTGVTNFLALNKDYTVTYNYNTSNKTYTATVKGMGKFDGSFTTPTPISYPTERIILTAQNTEIVVNEKEGLSGVIETPDGKELVPNFARVYYKPDKDHKYLLKKDIDYKVGYFYVYNNGVRTGNYTIQITGKGIYSGAVSTDTLRCVEKENVAFFWGKDNLGFDNLVSLDDEIRNSTNGTALLNDAAAVLRDCNIGVTEADLNAAKADVMDVAKDNTGGFCGGMSIVTILRKQGVLQSDLSTDMLKACSVLAWHCQKDIRATGTKLDSSNLTDIQRIKKIEVAIDENKLVEICYNALPGENEMLSHAVVAYGYEDCSYYSDLTGTLYNHRLLICDPNGSDLSYMGDKRCLYYNDDGSWTVPYWNVYRNSTASNTSFTNIVTYN